MKLKDLDTDPPKGARICPDCKGHGMVIAWVGFMQSSKDCGTCEGNGWVICADKGVI